MPLDRHPHRHAAGSRAAPSSKAASRSVLALRVPARRRPADRDRRTGRGRRRRRAQPGAARRHRHRQDLHRRQDHRGDPAPRDHPRPEQDPRRATLRRVQGLLSRRTPSSTSCRTTTITSPRPTSPRTDTYIEKECQINEQIDRMRHSATRALLERDDVIIVASVSCIYGIGSAETYGAMTQDLVAGHSYDQRRVIADLVDPAVPPQRPGLPARQLPRPRRFARGLARPPRGPRLAAVASSARSSNSIARVRPADRRAHRFARPASASTPTRTT